jgi:hypothetical protein
MKFFENERVRDEVIYLQETFAELRKVATEFPYMDDDDKVYFLDNCLELIDKQKIMYTRISLSDQEDAQEMKRQMDNMAKIFGSNCGLLPVLNSMQEKMQGFRRILDTTD